MLSGGEAGGAAGEDGAELEEVGDGADAGVDGGGGTPRLREREGEVVVDGHGVVDDRELEDLGDVALGGGEAGDVAVVEEDLAFARDDEAGDDVEERGLAAAGGAEERVGAAVLPLEVDGLQRVVVGAARVGGVAVAEVPERDPRHQATLRPSAAK